MCSAYDGWATDYPQTWWLKRMTLISLMNLLSGQGAAGTTPSAPLGVRWGGFKAGGSNPRRLTCSRVCCLGWGGSSSRGWEQLRQCGHLSVSELSLCLSSVVAPAQPGFFPRHLRLSRSESWERWLGKRHTVALPLHLIGWRNYKGPPGFQQGELGSLLLILMEGANVMLQEERVAWCRRACSR